MAVLVVFFTACAVFSLGYWAVLTGTVGFITFSWFWPAAALAFGALAFVCYRWQKGRWKISARWRSAVIGIVILAVALFGYVEAKIVLAGRKTPEPGAKYMIVLGCGVEGERPSLSLYYRIEKAAEYAASSPDTVLILTGGLGDGAQITEAECMARELEKRGISRDRMILEDKARNTKENLLFSMKLMDSPADRVVLVTSSYHVYRATEQAKKLGLVHAEGMRAKPGPVMELHYSVREVIAVIRYRLSGDI